MDILAALDGTPKPRTANAACRIGKWLDTIPDTTPGKPGLVATLTETDHSSPDWRTLEQLDAILRQLGVSTSNKTLGNHRMKRCRCYV